MPPVRALSRNEMMQRVALFKNLQGSTRGLADSDLPECQRELFNVIGFQAPDSNNGEKIESPVGANASAAPAIPISEGFNMGFVKAKPGCGPLMHNHDTNETFMPITGTWRCAWNEGDDYEYIDVGPLDIVSFPPGVQRRFINVTKGEGLDKEHIMLFVISGDNPAVEFSDDAYRKITEFTKVPEV